MNTSFVWGVLSTLGITGCATSGAVGAAPGRTPDVQASVEASESLCRTTASAQVVASHVYVPGGVEASLDDAGATVRFALRKGHCAVAHAASGHFVTDEAPSECPGELRDVVATSEGETIFARESDEGIQPPHIELGVVVHAVPSLFGFAGGDRESIVEHAFEPAARSHGGEKSPGLVPLPGERFLLLWVDGDAQGHMLRAQPVAGWGAPVGRAVDLSPSDVSVIGRASAAVGPDGRGIVAFVASTGNGFDVLATPIACDTWEGAR